MANGITGFYNIAQQREFARDFQFRVVTLGPLTEDDLVYVRTASLPAKTINNQQVPYMGLNFNVPGTVAFPGSDDWAVKFLADEAMNLHSKLSAWINEVFSVETSSGKYGVPSETATLDLLDKSFKTIRRYNLVGVYLKLVDPVAYDIAGSGKPQELTGHISYQFWREITA